MWLLVERMYYNYISNYIDIASKNLVQTLFYFNVDNCIRITTIAAYMRGALFDRLTGTQ